jgi:hypothetical protein
MTNLNSAKTGKSRWWLDCIFHTTALPPFYEIFNICMHLPGVAWHNRVPPSLAVRCVVPFTYGMVRRKEAFTTWALAGNVGADVTVRWFAWQSTAEHTAD